MGVLHSQVSPGTMGCGCSKDRVPVSCPWGRGCTSAAETKNARIQYSSRYNVVRKLSARGERKDRL